MQVKRLNVRKERYANSCTSEPCSSSVVTGSAMENTPNSRVLRTFKCRWFVVLFASLELFLFSGPTYGWAEFVIILKKEKFFSSLCAPSLNATTSLRDDSQTGCKEQNERLNLVFNVALCLTFCGGAFVCGLCLDKFGTRVARTLGSGLFILSGIFMSLSLTYDENFIFPGLSLLQIGGSIFLISSFQVANLSERFGNTIIAVLNGCFDSSAMVLTFFKMIYFSGVPLLYIYIGYFVIAITSTLAFNYFFLPYKYIPPYRTIVPFVGRKDEADEVKREEKITDENDDQDITSLFCSQEDNDDVEDNEYSRKNFLTSSSGSSKSEQLFPYGTSSKKIMMSRFYFWHAACFAIIHLRNWVFIGSLNDLLEVVSGRRENKVELYTDVFGLIQFNGIFVNLLSGFATDMMVKKTGSILASFTIMFFVTVTAAVIMSVTSIIPILEVQVVSFISYAILRGLIYNNYSGVIALLLPQEKMGLFYGVGSMVGSWFASLQYAVFIIIQRPLHGNPFWANVGLLALVLVAYCHPLNMLKTYRERKKSENTPLMFSKSYDNLNLQKYNSI